MRKYSSPHISYVELFLEERIAAGCMEITVLDGTVLCQDYTAVQLNRPCCETNES